MNRRIRPTPKADGRHRRADPARNPPWRAPVSERSQARRETIRLLLHRPAFIHRNIIIIGWIICAVLGQRITPYDPFNYFHHVTCRRARSTGWGRTGSGAMSCRG